MGVPVVSLRGDTAVSRGGFSILSNVGLPELCALIGELAGSSLSVAATSPAKATPNRDSPTISPVAISTPSRSANSGLGARLAHSL